MTYPQYEIVLRKIQYYQRWWNELNVQDRKGWLGHWIKKRIEWYDIAISDYAEKN